MNKAAFFALAVIVILFAPIQPAFAIMTAPSFKGVHGEAPPIGFSHACDGGDDLVISAVGDFLFHSPLQIQADRSPLGYESLWTKALPLFAKADIRYGNLEGPVAPGVLPNGKISQDPGLKFDNNVYSSYPRFNYPGEVAKALAQSGLTIVSTANNHAMDRGANGADETIASLRANGVKFIGTHASNETPTWYEMTKAKGFTLAWVACSFSTNGLPDRNKQVLGCFTDTAKLLTLVRTLSNTAGIDAVIVTPHWGVEYQAKPSQQQITLGKQLMEAGALAVIGTHPHVLEPWEKYVSADGKEHFLIYSTGNFISGQTGVPMITSVLVYLELGRNTANGTFIRGVGYVPVQRDHTGQGYSVRPLMKADDQAPAQAWTIWNAFYGPANRVLGTDNLSAKFCALK